MRALPPTETLLGQDALGVVLALARQLPEATFSFLRYLPSPPAEERVLGDRRRELDSLPAIELVALLARQPELAVELTRHEPGAEEKRTTRFRSAEVLAGVLRSLTEALSGDEVLGIRSECTIEGAGVLHLPLMDFRVAHGPSTVAGLRAAIQRTAPWGGVLLDSGRSFHLYGAQLLSPVDWIGFMSQCLLLSPLTDPRYIGHRLLSQFSVLRLTSSPCKPFVPRVVAAV